MKRSVGCLSLACILLASCLQSGTDPSSARRSGAAPAIGFIDRSAEADLPTEDTRSWGVTLVDYDGNGYPDLLIGRHLRPPWFLTNGSGSFAVREEPALKFKPKGQTYYDRHDCAWGEFSRDGRPDLYCVSGAQKGSGTGPNQLLEQTENGSLRDRSAEMAVRDPYGRGRAVAWLDYDGDGDLDLFVGNEVREAYPNTLFKRTRSGFRRVDAGVSEQMSTSSAAAADWNGDRRPDLLVAVHGSKGSVAYRNAGGRFVRTDLSGVSGVPLRSAAFGDYNGDGWIDLVVVDGQSVTILRNDGGTFRRVFSRSFQASRSAIWLDVENDGDLDVFVVQGREGDVNRRDLLVIKRPTGFAALRSDVVRGPRRGDGDTAAAADFDRDGRVDLVVTNGFGHSWGPVKLHRNITDGGSYIALEIDGGRRNPWGIGARLRIRTRDRTIWRTITDGISARSQSEVGHLVVGLGSADSASIRIHWPGGSSSCHRMEASQTATLKKGHHPC